MNLSYLVMLYVKGLIHKISSLQEDNDANSAKSSVQHLTNKKHSNGNLVKFVLIFIQVPLHRKGLNHFQGSHLVQLLEKPVHFIMIRTINKKGKSFALRLRCSQEPCILRKFFGALPSILFK